MREAEAKILKRRSSGGFGMETYLSGFAMLHDRPEDLNSQIISTAMEDVKKFRLSLIDKRKMRKEEILLVSESFML
ncbi:hypothetical protein Ahy_B01g056738 [Arachis hypogaea]|uniref:Uncharacterized protein n=1 Tax=Arachis hypogaea TaxID=3818 RepID=A0A445AZL5_ARAHY|nr:hypothetical protein Ahy_B01g056738 [Arachis hypogaea]